MYAIGSRSGKHEIWKYSISSQSWSVSPTQPAPLMAPSIPYCSKHHALTVYQSQPVFIGGYVQKSVNNFTSSKRIYMFNEDCGWKEDVDVIPPLPAIEDITLNFVSASSEGNHLIVAWEEGGEVKLLCFDGQKWKRREGPRWSNNGVYKISLIIRKGIVVLTQHCSLTLSTIHRATLETLFADASPSDAASPSNVVIWKEMTNDNPPNLSNFTILGEQCIIVAAVVNANPAPVTLDALVMTFKSFGYWNMIKKFEFCCQPDACLSIVSLSGEMLLVMGMLKTQPGTIQKQFVFLKR